MGEMIPEALFDPKCYPEPAKKVRMVQTHTSWVFLTGKYAYKIKKPVDFGFLNYTTLARRKKSCDEEIRLNRRLCPWLYLDVVPVVRSGDTVTLGKSGEVVDYAVKMRELPQSSIMTELIKKKRIDFELVDRMAKIVADFHDKAEVSDEISKHGSMATIKYNWDENFLQTLKFIDSLIQKREYRRIKESVNRFMTEKRDFFEKRVKQGKVKWLHGDFHSGNIFVTDRICIFDCIEFNPRFSCSDAASEIAFLLMDLDFLDSKELGDYFLHRYVQYSRDTEILSVVDFYKSYRAYVRGKVLGFKVFSEGVKQSERNKSKAAARKYFKLSHHYVTRLFDRPIFAVVYGLPGVGKSFISKKIAKSLNIFHLRTDIIRKELASVALDQHKYSEFGKGLYSERMTVSTYRRVLELARILLSHGKGCVLDGGFSRREWRVRASELAEELGVPFYSIYCECAEKLVSERMATRTRDPSDATQEIYLKMKDHFDPPEAESIIIDTSERLSILMGLLLSQLAP